jgi:hypothetical protein
MYETELMNVKSLILCPSNPAMIIRLYGHVIPGNGVVGALPLE